MSKKTYIKPDVYCESFEMSQHVATCAWDMSNLKNKEECAAVADEVTGMGDVALFTQDTICSLLDSAYSDYCYTNGEDGFNVFNS